MNTPRCMSVDEMAAWTAENDIITPGNRATSPCRDCCAAFARSQRAIGLCDGHYPREVIHHAPVEPVGPLVDRVRPGPNGDQTYWGYADEHDRLEARRATFRRAYRLKRLAASKGTLRLRSC